jgi:hypothetical protein
MRKWQVESLPREDRDFIDQYLVDHDFHGYDGLRESVRRRGLDVGVNALQGYGRRLRMRREEERAIARGLKLGMAVRSSKRLAESAAKK